LAASPARIIHRPYGAMSPNPLTIPVTNSLSMELVLPLVLVRSAHAQMPDSRSCASQKECELTKRNDGTGCTMMSRRGNAYCHHPGTCAPASAPAFVSCIPAAHIHSFHTSLARVIVIGLGVSTAISTEISDDEGSCEHDLRSLLAANSGTQARTLHELILIILRRCYTHKSKQHLPL